MIKIINESTGKAAITIKDNGDILVEGDKIIITDTEVKEAFDKAKKVEE